MSHSRSASLNVYQVTSTQSPAVSAQPKTILSVSQSRTKRQIQPMATRDRRREQNRAAQAAFRERSKLKIVELETQLSNSIVYSQNMHGKMQDLYERLEALRGELVDVLAAGPPSSPAVSSF